MEGEGWTGHFIVFINIFIDSWFVPKWNWMFGNVSPVAYSLSKLDGIINMFGCKAGRVSAAI